MAHLHTAPVVSSSIAHDSHLNHNSDIYTVYFAKCQLQAKGAFTWACMRKTLQALPLPLSRSAAVFPNVKCTTWVQVAAVSRCCSRARTSTFWILPWNCCRDVQVLYHWISTWKQAVAFGAGWAVLGWTFASSCSCVSCLKLCLCCFLSPGGFHWPWKMVTFESLNNQKKPPIKFFNSPPSKTLRENWASFFFPDVRDRFV